MIEELKNKTNQIALLWIDDYNLYNKNTKLTFSCIDIGVVGCVGLMLDNLSDSHLFFKYDIQSMEFIISLYKVFPIKRTILIMKDYGTYLYPMEFGKDDIKMFCDNFIYLPDATKFITNNLTRRIQNVIKSIK